jgi:hypothetical protein
MNSISKIPTENPKRAKTRYFILPVRSYVAKVLIWNPTNIWKVVPPEERKYSKGVNIAWYSYLTNETELREKFKIYHVFLDLILFETLRFQLIFKDNSNLFIEQNLYKKILTPCIFEYYNSVDLPEYLTEYIKKGFILIKVKYIVGNKKGTIQNSKHGVELPTIQHKIEYLNDFLETAIKYRFSYFIGIRGTKPISSIKNFYTIFDISEDELPYSTLVKFYQKNKQEIEQIAKSNSNSLHSKIPDYFIIKSYQEFLDKKKTLKEIAYELNVSESTLKSIFSNPEIQKKL